MLKKSNSKTELKLVTENQDLRIRLDEAEETLRAIRSGEVDALVVSGGSGEQIFTLKSADRSYRMLIEDMNEGALTMTADGLILYANRYFAEMLMAPLEKVIGSTIDSWMATDSQKILQSLMQKGKAKQRRGELALTTGAGTQLQVYLSVSELAVDELLDTFCLVATDMTERKQVEDTLRQNETRLRLAIDTLDVAVFGQDMNLRYTWMYQPQLGYTARQVLGKTDAELLPQPDALIITEIKRRALDSGKRVREEVSVHPSDQTIIFDLAVEPMHDVNGKVTGLVGVTLDITERKQGQEKLLENERRFRALVENISDVIMLVDVEGRMLYTTPSAQNVLGYTIAELQGRQVFEFIHPDDLTTSLNIFKEILSQPGLMAEIVIQVVRKDGGIRWVQISSINLLAEPSVGAIVSVLHDISKQVQDNQALHESKLFAQGTLDALSAHIAILDASGQIVAVNHAWREFAIANHPSPQSVCEGANYLAICDAAHGLNSGEAASMAQGLRAIISGAQNDYALEYPCHAPNEERWFIARATKFKEQGPLQIVIAHENITERKGMEEALRESEAELAEAQRIAHVGSWDWVAETDTPTWSKELRAILEFNPNQPAPSMSDQDKLYTPESMQRMRAAAEQTMQTGMSYEIELERVRKDGSSQWLLARGERWVNEQGKLMGLRGTGLDITERKQAEEKLLANEERLRQVWEATSDAMVLSDANGIVLSANPAYCSLYGYTPEQIIGRSFAIIFPEVDQAQALEQYKAVFNGENIPPAFEAVVQHADRTEHIVESKISFLTNAGQRTAMLSTIRDITEHKQVEETRKQYTLELERRVEERTRELTYANRAKDEFLANMSHELRTPLNSVLGLSETLLEQHRDPLSARQQTSLQIIESSGRHLLALINDVLDLSKIEAGKFDYYPEVVDVDNLCHGSLVFIREQALRKSITVTYQQKTTVSKIYADPRRLKQILVNLLGNAVKFTPGKGEITLQVDADIEQDRIRFSIMDTGIGIAAEDMHKLFQPFVQLDSRLTREYEGTGLGLALVQRLTDLHGGSVSVESDGLPGKGSCFTINLAIGQAILAQQIAIPSGGKIVDQAVYQPAAQPVGFKTILLVEDNMSNILTMGDYLEMKGYQVLVAHDGIEALEQADAHQPDIILMDIQMPGMDGLEAIRQLRKDIRFATTPIIALTALAMPGDRERCLAAGANEYMSKPVSLKSLVKTIDNFLAHQNEPWLA